MGQLLGKNADWFGIEIDKTDSYTATADGSSETFSLTAHIHENSEVVIKKNGTELEETEYSVDYKNEEFTVNTVNIDDTVLIEYKGWSYPFTEESCSNIDGEEYKEYQIDTVERRVLDIFKSFIVYVNDNQVNESDYTVDTFKGKIKFKEALTSSDIVTCDGSFIKIVEIGTLYSWELDISAERVDGQTFREDFPNEIPIYPTFSGSIEGYHVDEYFVQYVDFDNKVWIGKFWLDYDRYYIGWFHMDITITADKDDLIKESLSISGYRNLEYIEDNS